MERTRKAPKVLTDTFLKSAKTALPQEPWFDAGCTGLAIRVTKAGKKTWTFHYTSPRDGGRANVSFATYPATGLDAARDRARAMRGLVEAGTDPRDIQPEVPDKTVAELVDDRVRLVLRADAENFLWSCMEIERVYDRDVIPVVGQVKLKDFRISHLNLVIDPILARGSATQANRTFEHVRALFNFAVRRGEIPYSPLAAAEAPSEKNEKDRFLDLDEIKTLWTDAPLAIGRSDHVPTILKLILATGGQRPGEVAGIERPEIDAGKKLWIIPKHKAKNKREHHVPLNDLAMSLILAAMRVSNSKFLFPNEEGDGSVPNYTLAQTVARALKPTDELPLGRLGIAKFTPHDLRRTVATQMSLEDNGLEIPDHEISYLLNHRSAMRGSVTQRVYIVNQHIPEKRRVSDKWGAFLARLVGVEIEQREAA